ncbi:type II toxin-antitoxin system RelE/ParE family toxin [Pseudomonas avellanae]|uniref:type II toxin-antitoxin system RelE/ParE family toxin n=1 Tax=Pseudomonas avellanae TaxID=46257 RepID=UPI0004651E33|nr:type II toxin-antitoxin system RelE/ParE family toxin [Pseudomonas avellanae]
MSKYPPTSSVKFFCTEAGNEPVREWLTDLLRDDRKAVGTDIKTVQFGWPIGMPVVRKMEPDLREVRADFKERIARVLFTVEASSMVLLHGFIKKSEKTPASDLETARQRKAALKRNK